MITNKEIEDDLIEHYEYQFKQKTGKCLIETIKNRKNFKTSSIKITVPLIRIVEIINEHIPPNMQFSHPTIITPRRFRELVDLKMIFSYVCVYLGHTRKAVQNVLKTDHTTIIYHLKEMKAQLNEKYNNPDIIHLYTTILTQIQQEHERNIQPDNTSQSNTQSSVSSTQRELQTNTTLDQRESRTQVNYTGMGEFKRHDIDSKGNLLSETIGTYWAN